MTDAFNKPAVRLTANVTPLKVDERTRRFKLSDSSVALDGHTLKTSGWDLTRAADNLPVLWAHDSETVNHVLGQWENLHVEGDSLLGDAVFMPREMNPTAGMVLDMIDAGYLRMCSVGFVPTDGKPSDRGPGKFDFTKQTLLEASIVPVGSLASALVQARDAGIDISPVHEWAAKIMEKEMAREPEWKCGASRNLPLDEVSEWNAGDAACAIFAACGFDGEKPDHAKARKAFLIHDPANPKDETAYRFPIASVVNGRLVANATALREALGIDMPLSSVSEVRSVIDHYAAKSSRGTFEDEKPAFTITKRGLYSVAQLAMTLKTLGILADNAEDESETEGDDSGVPAMLQGVLKSLGEALIAMTKEEVGELLASGEDFDAGASYYWSADSETRGLIHDALRDAADGRDVTITTTRSTGKVRAGREISAENMSVLGQALDHCSRAAEHLRCVMKRDDEGGGGGGGDAGSMSADPNMVTFAAEAEARAKRERIAKLAQLQASD